MSPSWIWSDKLTNERVARVGYNHFISNKGEGNNCFSKFSNRVLRPIFISTILQSVRKENLAHHFPYDVKLGLLAHSRSFLAKQKARNTIVGAENLLTVNRLNSSISVNYHINRCSLCCSRGRARTQLQLLPRSLQKTAASSAPAPSSQNSNQSREENTEAKNDNEPKKGFSNEYFRNLMQRKNWVFTLVF